MKKKQGRWVLLLLLLAVLLAFPGLLSSCAPGGQKGQRPARDVVRVVMDNNYPPYIFEDDAGIYRGILVDQWELWQERTGVDVEITALPWSEALERMRAGEFDVIDTIFYTEERARLYDFTPPYTKINVLIFFQQNISGIANADDLRGFRVAVKLGDANAEYLLAQGVKDLVYYASYEEIVKAVAGQEETIFVIDQPPGLYFLHKFGIQGQFNYSEPLYGGEFHRAVKKGDDELLNLVNLGFASISKAEYEEINNRWFGFSYQDILEQYKFAIGVGVVVILLVFAGLFFFNRILQSQVKARTLELQATMANLQESETRFREAMEFLPIPIGIADLSGNLLFINREFSENYGYTIEDIPSIETWAKYAYPDPEYREKTFSIWQKDVSKAQAEDSATPLRAYKVTCKDGSQCDVEIIMRPVAGFWVAAFNNVTVRNQTERSLRLFKESVENSTDAIGMSDPQGRHYYQNKAFSHLFGEIGENPPETLYVDKHIGRGIFQTIRAGGRWAGEVKMYAADKSVLNIFLRAYANLNDDDKIIGLVGIHTDVTEGQIAEMALRESEQRYRALFEHANDAIFIETEDDIILDVNERACQMLGYTREELLSRKVTDLIAPELHRERQAIRRELSEYGGKPFESFDVCKDGTIIPVEVTNSILPDGLVLSIVRNITERKHAEDELRKREHEVLKLNAELERRVIERTSQLEIANKELEAFAYSVSHDLRAPLRAIAGFSRILMEDFSSQMNPEVQALLERVSAAGKDMNELVDALLELSRMTRAELNRESVNMSLLAHRVVEDLRQINPERKARFSIQDRVFADGDARLLGIVLENLLGNAWKFTSKQKLARVKFGMQLINGENVYYVRDNGAGFDMAYADKLFRAFQRLHSPVEFEGTGIGLVTVQRIVHRHAGRIWAESEPGNGATFYFVLG